MNILGKACCSLNYILGVLQKALDLIEPPSGVDIYFDFL